MVTLETLVNVVPLELTETRYSIWSRLHLEQKPSAIQPVVELCLTVSVCVLVSCPQGDPGRPGRPGPSGSTGEPGPKVNHNTWTGIAALCWDRYWV